MKCYSCKHGNVTQSGSHLYCDNCNFSAFVITSEYISDCAAMMGTLVSNTKFDSVEGYRDTVLGFIDIHQPVFSAYLHQELDKHAFDKFFTTFLEEVVVHSVNLQGPMFSTLNAGEKIVPLDKVTTKNDTALNLCVACGHPSIAHIDRIIAECSREECGQAYRINKVGGYTPI